MITYRYALDTSGDVVDIIDLDKTQRGEYICVGCGDTLIPVFPSQNISRHFRHKSDCICNGESYLHRIAKYTLARALSQCAEFGGCVIEYRGRRACINRAFSSVVVEGTHRGYKPDVTLESSDCRALCFEINFTHKISVKKSLLPDSVFIEFDVKDESDIHRLLGDVFIPDRILFNVSNIGAYISSDIVLRKEQDFYIERLKQVGSIDLGLSSHRCIALELDLFIGDCDEIDLERMSKIINL